MAIKSFDRAACREVSDKVLEAIKPVAAQLGLAVKKAPGNFSPENFIMKLEFSVIGEEGVAITRERQDYENQCFRFGLKKEWLDKVFSTSDGRNFQITGLRPRGRRYPVIAKDVVTNKSFKFNPRTVIRAMES